MTTIETVLILIVLGIAIETTSVDDKTLSSSVTVCVTSEPGGGQIPPPLE